MNMLVMDVARECHVRRQVEARPVRLYLAARRVRSAKRSQALARRLTTLADVAARRSEALSRTTSANLAR